MLGTKSGPATSCKTESECLIVKTHKSDFQARWKMQHYYANQHEAACLCQPLYLLWSPSFSNALKHFKPEAKLIPNPDTLNPTSLHPKPLPPPCIWPACPLSQVSVVAKTRVALPEVVASVFATGQGMFKACCARAYVFMQVGLRTVVLGFRISHNSCLRVMRKLSEKFCATG